MSVDRRAVHDAYRRTTYRATIDGERVEIRIGEVAPRLDALLRARGAPNWAFLTAANPHASLLAEHENVARHADLVRAVEAAGVISFEGESSGDDGAWPPERSLLVLGVSETEAVRIACHFDQEAIVVGALEQGARLVFCEEAP